MKLDLLYEVDVPKPWDGPHPQGQRKGEQQAYDEALEQIRLADEAGFNCVWMVEHHFREGRSHCPSPEVVIGALTQTTRRIKLGYGVTLLPYAFTHPARVAEKVATADVLSKGRVEWGTGRSTPMEQTAFGVDREKSRDQWREAIQIIVSMWEKERFSWDSPSFQFPERVVTPKPYQDPHPPCWVAASSPDTAAIAGENGLGLLSLSILKQVDELSEQIRQYRQASRRAKPLTRVHNDRVAAYTLVHCAETLQQAETNGIWDSVWWWYKNLAEFTIEWELPNMAQEEVDRVFPFLERQAEGGVPIEEFDAADMIVVGDPERCLEKMRRYEEIGVDQLICYVQFGYLPHESVMKTIELLGTEVIPKLKG
ncbi:MAG: LLM class flavin-dependent oxidoreductase [Proteobacteria bacterium]|nr:LLM class flavin-dependent oxidoreductase [Pseudomonadota bacterium]